MVVTKLRPYIPFKVVGENRKSLRVQRKDLKFVSIDVKPSAGFKRKTNPTEGGMRYFSKFFYFLVLCENVS